MFDALLVHYDERGEPFDGLIAKTLVVLLQKNCKNKGVKRFS